MKKPTIPHLIILFYAMLILGAYIVFKPKNYPMNGYMPSSDYIHSEIQP